MVGGLCAVVGFGGAPALANVAGERVSLTESEAQAELEDVIEEAQIGDPAKAHPTLELRDLARALPALRGKERRRAKAILARPTDGSDPFGGGWPGITGISYTEQTTGTSDFTVHWPEYPTCEAPEQGCDEPDLTDGPDPGTTPDYIDQIVAAVEDSRSVQNTDLGWPDYKPDGTKGGDGKLDIYVADICNEFGGACVFGYANTDDGSSGCHSPPFKCSAYLVLDNDYNQDEFASYAEPGVPLRVTTAHEYNHILQFNIDANQDRWMFEATATWSEDKTFPADDDWLFYTQAWARSSRAPLTSTAGGSGLKQYGSAVWNHWVEHGYSDLGADVVLDAWEVSRETDPKDFSLAAYNRALKDAGGRNLSREFANFAAATAEWRTGEGDLPNAPDLEDMWRQGKLRFGGPMLKTSLNHTAFTLLDVDPKRAKRIRLKGKIDRGARSAVALVGRDGSRKGGAVEIVSSFERRGGKFRVVLTKAQSFNRITAVAVNADGRPGPGGSGFASDNVDFKLKIR